MSGRGTATSTPTRLGTTSISYWIIVFSNAYRIIVATDRRIVVVRAGRFSMTTAQEVLRELPRHTQIGPPAGLWYRTDALGEKLYVNRRFFKDVEAADGLAGAPAAPPPPPPSA